MDWRVFSWRRCLNAEMSEGWHLYSQFVDESNGPVATSFQFKETDQIELVGAVQEPDPIEAFDENFEGIIKFFEHNVRFVQKIRMNNADIIECVVTFMICNDTMCFPPEDQLITIEIK